MTALGVTCDDVTQPRSRQSARGAGEVVSGSGEEEGDVGEGNEEHKRILVCLSGTKGKKRRRNRRKRKGRNAVTVLISLFFSS